MSVFKYYFMFFDLLYPIYMNKVFSKNVYKVSNMKKIVVSNYMNNLKDSLDVSILKSLFLLSYFSNKHPKMANLDIAFVKGLKLYKYSGSVNLWKFSEFFLFIDFFVYCLQIFLKRRNLLCSKVIEDEVNAYTFIMRDLGFFPFMGYFFFDWSYMMNVSLVFKKSSLFNKYVLKFLKMI